MDPIRELELSMTRRQLFGKAAIGVGTAALHRLLAGAGVFGLSSIVDAQGNNGVHFPPKAKNVIYLFMNGGPSQLDLWDYKPKMGEKFDSELPAEVRRGQRITTMTSGQTRFPVAPSKYKFTKHDNND